ncbi:MAG: M23 family metallopeptidase [Oscillospiraceae bacterium]|nr:M23 family metallopeptidase [Oscillospiraceae bacterium]
MSKKKFSGSVGGKGYYIALVLCAVAIGITGYLYYRNAGDTNDTLQNPPASVGEVGATQNDDVQAVATQPDGSQNVGTEPSSGGQTATKPAKTKSPVEGKTVAEFSMDALSYNQTTRDWRVHDGVDIGAEAGTKVCAAADGTVYTVYEDETMGMTVVIRHDGGYTTKYASLAEEVSVKAGDTVTAGQIIGCVGSTALLESAVGDHVHFSVSCDGKVVDPAQFLA